MHNMYMYLLMGIENGITECLLCHFMSHTLHHYWGMAEMKDIVYMYMYIRETTASFPGSSPLERPGNEAKS